MEKKILNLGLLAHADAGKTTLTEQLLYLGGVIKSLGDVDKGTTHSDFLDVEKERGISVRSAVNSFTFNGIKINLIDTPGHIDFYADVERNLSVLDALVLVVSAVEGVQAHTENIWQAIEILQLPCIVFINKTDRIGADVEAVYNELKSDLSDKFLALQKIEFSAEQAIEPESIWNENVRDDRILEQLAVANDKLLEQYLNGDQIGFDFADKVLESAIKSFNIIPVLVGSAKRGIGLNQLLNSIVNYLTPETCSKSKNLEALVYRVDYIEGKGKVVGLRLYSGNISNKDVVFNATKNIKEKVHQVWQYNGGLLVDSGYVESGDVAAISGLVNANVGDVIGHSENIAPAVSMFTPLLTLQVRAVNDKDYAKLAEALSILSEEDPALDLEWLRDVLEFHVKIMGWIQIEILQRTLDVRFGIDATFDEPTVIYKETPKTIAEGFARYWMPKPCWAIIKFKICPGEHGSGVVYESKISKDKVHQKYQNEVERTIDKALKQGIKGWEVTDLIVTFIDGEDHEVHSRPGDFSIATPMAIMNGLVNTDTVFLEPVNGFRIKAPLELLGAITSDIIQMRGSFNSPEITENKMEISGEIPLSTSIDFPVKLSSRSGGKAKIKTWFAGYQKCKEEHGKTRPYKGVSPLDEAKYILKARKAIQESFK